MESGFSLALLQPVLKQGQHPGGSKKGREDVWKELGVDPTFAFC